MVKEHHAKQSKRKQEQEVRRKEAIETSNELTQSLVDHLNVGYAKLKHKAIYIHTYQHTNVFSFSYQCGTSVFKPKAFGCRG